MALINTTEFTGLYKISNDQYTAANLQLFIDRYQEIYLVQLFGVDLYNLFLTATTGGTVPPTETRFVSVFNKFFIENTGGNGFFYTGDARNPCIEGSVEGGFAPNSIHKTIYISKGIKEMLKGFVYYHYNRENDVHATPTGNNTQLKEAATAPPGNYRNNALTTRYNEAIETYEAIQYYMKSGDNSSDYPEYNGISLAKIYMGGAL